MADLMAPLEVLRAQSVASTPLDNTELVPDLWWHRDMAGDLSGQWRSPRGRLLELDTQVSDPGGFLALHLRLPPFDIMACNWFGFVARTNAASAMITRVCLRSGTGEGFHDQFFARHILSQPGASDHHDLLVPAQCPDLPRAAPWREFILFLPPNRALAWALQDLRLIVL